MTNKGVLESLISEDFEVTGTGRWLKTSEHDSLVIDTENEIFFWNSHGIVGKPIDWLMKVKGLSYEQSISILKNFENYHGEFIHFVKGKQEQDIIVYPALVEVFWQNGINNREYWYKRTITDETIDRYKLGYYDGWYTIPFYQDGLFKDFQCRRDEPKKMIKHWYKGIGISLFNTDVLKITDKIYIVEAPTSALVMNQNGLLSISQNGGSHGWQDNWFKYFMYQKEIYILYDNDDAGRSGAKQLAKKLGEFRTKLYNFIGFSEHFDAGDFFKAGGTAKELVELVNNKSYYSFDRERE